MTHKLIYGPAQSKVGENDFTPPLVVFKYQYKTI